MNIASRLTPDQNQHLAAVTRIVQERMPTDAAGHDYDHVERVTRLAQDIAIKEGADLYVTTLIALLHDIADHKFHDGDRSIGATTAAEILKTVGVPEDVRAEVCFAIPLISYSGSGGKQNIFPVTTEDGSTHITPAACAQDADRLDAIGAIGVARSFAYGSSKNTPLYSTSNPANTLQHFDDKLLKLYGLLNTETARVMGMPRHQYLIDFKKQFLAEWGSSSENRIDDNV